MGRPTTGRPTLYQKPKLFRQILFRLRREILHILYALEHGRSVVLEIQTPPELIERTETLPLGPTVDVLVHFGNDFESLLVDRRADLHCLGSAQKRFDRSLAIVHARRNRKVQLRQHGRTDRHHTQDVAQFRRLAVRRTLYESHPLDIHVRLEETVEKDYAPGPVTEQSARQGRRMGSFTETGIFTAPATRPTISA